MKSVDMRKMVRYVDMLFTVAFVLALPVCDGAVVRTKVTPHYHDDVIPDAFNIRCSIPKEGNCATSIVSMRVTKDGDKVIAGILRDDSIFYGRHLRHSVEVEGHIDAHPDDSFLSVTVKNAVREDSGLYACQVSYFDDSFHSKVEIDIENVTINNQDTRDLIRHFLSKQSLMQNLLQFQLETYAKNYTLLQSQMAEKDQEQNEKLQALQDRIDELAKATRCPCNWVMFQDGQSCFRAYDTPMSYTAARNTCRREGGDLVMIKSQAQNDVVLSLFNHEHIWIGAWDEHHNTQWTYVDGSALTYENWYDGQPDNSGGLEACAHIYGMEAQYGGWNDISCQNSFVFVCEMPVRAT